MAPDHNERITTLERKVRKLEDWQIKIALIVTAGTVIVGLVVGWFVKYSLDKMAAQLLNGR